MRLRIPPTPSDICIQCIRACGRTDGIPKQAIVYFRKVAADTSTTNI
jgi:hypothetical protein